VVFLDVTIAGCPPQKQPFLWSAQICAFITLSGVNSADTIVPGPANPQAFNRYSYVFNNPLKYIDPNGHCPSPSVPGGTGAENRAARAESGRCNALVNTILNSWDKTDYWKTKWPDKAAFKKHLGDSPTTDYNFFLPYWMEYLYYEKEWDAAQRHNSTPCTGCSGKVESDLADYVAVTYGAGFAPGVGISEVSIIVDQYWNVYIRLASSVNTRGFSASIGDAFVNTSPDGNLFGQRVDLDSLNVSEAEKVRLLQGVLTGHSASASGTWWAGPGASIGLQAPYNVTAEAVIGAPGLAVSPWSYTFLIREAK